VREASSVREASHVREASSANEGSVTAAGGVLAPREARAWLHLHRVFALRPELVASSLEAGATPDEILSKAIDRRDATALATRTVAGRRELDRDLSRLEAIGACIVPRGTAAYPERLSALVDAPCVLLLRGQAESLATTGIAIVGARAATQAARETARRLARDLAAQGLTIISGLARGIDAAAHRGALDVDGRTIAVLACGPDRIYPPEHRDLAHEITRRGAIVSEMPVGTPPRRAHFPLRNRLISGLSIGVIVVEARRRSGSLITVRHALNQGREVFVVPGAVGGPFAEGTNLLLRDGARPILDAHNVIEDLGLTTSSPPRSTFPTPRSVSGSLPGSSTPDSPAALVLALLEDGPLTRDVIADRAALEPGSLARALLELELANRIVLDRDGRLQRNWS
jgi:DNA processing protein